MLMPPIHNVKLIIKTSDSVTVQVSRQLRNRCKSRGRCSRSRVDARVDAGVAPPMILPQAIFFLPINPAACEFL
jgi:hypothetical protein